MGKGKIAIVEDHQLFREGIKYILTNTGVFDVTGEFNSGKEFIQSLEYLNCDVVLMDIAMPEMDGIESTIKALERRPDLKVIVLSILGDEEYYSRMIEAGAKGFVSKEAKPAELINAINEVANNGTFFSQELLRKIISNQNQKQKKESKIQSIVNEFSKRELQVLTLLCQGMTNSEIGHKLFISTRTVEGHRANLLKKTGTKNTVSLIMFALQHGIIKVLPE